MADLTAENDLGIARDAFELGVEIELAAFVGPYDLALAQLLDEAAEQRFVEEFRRVELQQQAQALRSQRAQVLQFAG